MKRFTLRLALAALAALALSASRHAAAQVQFKFTPLDVPASFGFGTSCIGINNRGVVVGNYATPDGLNVPGFVYQNGTFTSVTIPGSGGYPNPFFGLNFTGELTDINDEGIALGDSNDASGFVHGFLRHPDGTITSLPDIPGAYIGGTSFGGINNAGTIVGIYNTDPNADLSTEHGFILQGGVYTTVDYPGAIGTILNYINDRGQITGIWFSGDFFLDAHGFLLDRGVFTPIDFPGGANTLLFGINNKGQILGFYLDANFVRHSFLLDHGVFTPIDFPGAMDTTAIAINDHGQIVGNYDFAHGFVAEIVRGRGK